MLSVIPVLLLNEVLYELIVVEKDKIYIHLLWFGSEQ